MNVKKICAVMVMVLVMTTGCASMQRVNPRFDEYWQEAKPKKVAVILPDIRLHKLMAGGMTEERADWTVKAQQNMVQEILPKLKAFEGIEVEAREDLDIDAVFGADKGMWRALTRSLIQMPNDAKRKHFDYTFGEEVAQALGEEYDALLVLSGVNYFWSAGRIAMNMMSLLVQGGGYGRDNEWLYGVLLDRQSGDVLWFNYLAMPGDMRVPKVGTKALGTLLDKFKITPKG